MRCAVLGSPIGHSLSPVLHRAAYARLGLDWEYTAIECDEAALPSVLAGLDAQWAGLSLTMPLKAAVLPLLDVVDPTAALVGAVNTVLPRAGRLVGHNTDVGGLVAALTDLGVADAVAAGPVTVLGAGATARSALAALARLGARATTVHARRPAAAADLVALGDRLGVRVDLRGWAAAGEGMRAPLVVATTPAGVCDPLADDVPARPGTLFDVVYDPWPTPLAAAWIRRGGLVGSGLDLLVHQAALQVRLMTGTSLGVAELVAAMRPAGEAALRRG